MSQEQELIDRLGLGPEEVAALEEPDEDPAGGGAEVDADRDTAAEAADGTEPPLAVYIADAPENYEERVQALDSQTIEAEAKFKAGDLTFDEFRGEERRIAGERRALDDARLKYEISVEQTEQMSAARWKSECDRFFRDAARNDGIDYRANRPLWAALDTEVKELARNPANADKPGPWFLREAHRRVTATMHRQADDVTEAAAASAGRADFARIDRLSGLEQEAALARMSPEDADRYLSGRAR